jgi:hypothetical protein
VPCLSEQHNTSAGEANLEATDTYADFECDFDPDQAKQTPSTASGAVQSLTQDKNPNASRAKLEETDTELEFEPDYNPDDFRTWASSAADFAVRTPPATESIIQTPSAANPVVQNAELVIQNPSEEESEEPDRAVSDADYTPTERSSSDHVSDGSGSGISETPEEFKPRFENMTAEECLNMSAADRWRMSMRD